MTTTTIEESPHELKARIAAIDSTIAAELPALQAYRAKTSKAAQQATRVQERALADDRAAAGAVDGFLWRHRTEQDRLRNQLHRSAPESLHTFIQWAGGMNDILRSTSIARSDRLTAKLQALKTAKDAATAMLEDALTDDEAAVEVEKLRESIRESGVQL